jgi:hypothetical protein
MRDYMTRNPEYKKSGSSAADRKPSNDTGDNKGSQSEGPNDNKSG